MDRKVPYRHIITVAAATAFIAMFVSGLLCGLLFDSMKVGLLLVFLFGTIPVFVFAVPIYSFFAYRGMHALSSVVVIVLIFAFPLLVIDHELLSGYLFLVFGSIVGFSTHFYVQRYIKNYE